MSMERQLIGTSRGILEGTLVAKQFIIIRLTHANVWESMGKP